MRHVKTRGAGLLGIVRCSQAQVKGTKLLSWLWTETLWDAQLVSQNAASVCCLPRLMEEPECAHVVCFALFVQVEALRTGLVQLRHFDCRAWRTLVAHVQTCAKLIAAALIDTCGLASGPGGAG